MDVGVVKVDFLQRLSSSQDIQARSSVWKRCICFVFCPSRERPYSELWYILTLIYLIRIASNSDFKNCNFVNMHLFIYIVSDNKTYFFSSFFAVLCCHVCRQPRSQKRYYYAFIYCRKSVLLLRKRMFHVRLSRCSTDLR